MTMTEMTPNRGGRPSKHGERTQPIRVPVSKLPAVRAFIEGEPLDWIGEDVLDLLRLVAGNTDMWNTTATRARRLLARLECANQ